MTDRILLVKTSQLADDDYFVLARVMAPICSDCDHNGNDWWELGVANPLAIELARKTEYAVYSKQGRLISCDEKRTRDAEKLQDMARRMIGEIEWTQEGIKKRPQ